MQTNTLLMQISMRVSHWIKVKITLPNPPLQLVYRKASPNWPWRDTSLIRPLITKLTKLFFLELFLVSQTSLFIHYPLPANPPPHPPPPPTHTHTGYTVRRPEILPCIAFCWVLGNKLKEDMKERDLAGDCHQRQLFPPCGRRVLRLRTQGVPKR